jgi:hypothetical protein
MFGVMLIFSYTMFVCFVASRWASDRGTQSSAGEDSEQELVEGKLCPWPLFFTQ